jgi:hypothetical protein
MSSYIQTFVQIMIDWAWMKHKNETDRSKFQDWRDQLSALITPFPFPIVTKSCELYYFNSFSSLREFNLTR